jgi:beta-glucosidase
MTMEEKIAQMAQIDISLLLEDGGLTGKQLNAAAVERFIGQIGVGSILNTVSVPWTAHDYRLAAIQIQQVATDHGRPPVIWGLDSVHGANYVHNATITPQPINLAATWNVTVAHQAGMLAARDTRAAGINWLFSPLLGIALEPLWSRLYETFGEDPKLVGDMALHMILGIQEIDPNKAAIPSRAAACAKHFVGYSKPHNGHDRAPSWIPVRHLYQYFVPPWKAAMQANVMTVMESYTETDGVPNVANKATTNYLLRQRLGFDGVLVTDYNEIRNLVFWHGVSSSVDQAIQHSMRESSVDMSMIQADFDDFYPAIHSGLESHLVSEERINKSVERILRLKQKLNMFDEVLVEDDVNLELVGGDQEMALEMARQSLVLTKNDDGILPLQGIITSENNDKRRLEILVTGPTANSLIYQSGGWTWQWQGAPNEDDWFTYGTTVLGALSAEEAWDVSYSCGVDILGQECHEEDNDDNDNGGDGNRNRKTNVVKEVEGWVGLGSDGPHDSIGRAVEAASSKDIVVVCVGEEAYTEKPGDIRSLRLAEGQYQLVKSLKANTDAKVVLVYFGGRPRLFEDMVEQADAVVVGFLPGPSSGQALADIFNGRVNPSGRLPITYPRYDDGGGIPYFHSVSDQCTNGSGALPHWESVPCEVQWPFGHGLSYTTYQYSNLTATGGRGEDLIVSVNVKNTGSVSGSDTVMLFTFDRYRSTTPEYKRLRAFEKIFLEAGQEETVTKTIPASDLTFIGPHDDKHYISDPQLSFWVGVGASTDCRTHSDSELCTEVAPQDEEKDDYVGACDAACEIWARSGCADNFQMSKDACWNMCTLISKYPTSMTDKGNDGWGWNYVSCLESVVWGMEQKNEEKGPNQCWRMTGLCRDVFRTGQMDEYGIGPGGNSNSPSNNRWAPPVANSIALLSGLFAAALIFYTMRGGTFTTRRRRDDDRGEVQFSPVDNSLD